MSSGKTCKMGVHNNCPSGETCHRPYGGRHDKRLGGPGVCVPGVSVMGWPDWDVGVGAANPRLHVMANVGDINEPIRNYMGETEATCK